MEASFFDLKRLKYMSKIEMGQSPPSSEYSSSPESGLPFLQGTADFGVEYPDPKTFCSVPSKSAQKNDILFSVRAPVGELNVANREYGLGRGVCAVRCSNLLYQRFAWWALHWARQQLASEATGSTYEAVTADDVANLYIPFLPFHTQQNIANYLDDEITFIDTLTDAKQRLIKLLAEKRMALISNAILRGVNSNAQMCNTGIPWLSDIPTHWTLEYARWLFDEIDLRSETGDEELLSVSHLTGVTPRSEKDVNMFMAETNEGYKICQPGDLVINTLWAWMGAMGVAFTHGIVSPAYNVYRPTGEYNPHYLDYLVRVPNFAKEATRYSKGVWSSRLRLYPEEFFLIQMPVPPLDEQQEIVDFLDHEISKIDRLSQATQSSIDLLSERRTALISGAVTGQIEIPEASCN
jgi:type I restriction enzyme S subunit